MEGRPQKHLALIIARELASQLATATFIADAAGNLVFYNEAAEEILGRTFAEAGTMSADGWTSQFLPRGRSTVLRCRSSECPRASPSWSSDPPTASSG